MAAHVALLRAINVGGRNKVAMADLRDLFVALGYADARTLLQTGNVLFGNGDRDTRNLEAALENAAAERLGLKTDFFVRTMDEWTAIVAANPFPEIAEREPGRLVVVALKDAPSREAVEALGAAIVGREGVHADGRNAYVHYPDGIGRSKLTTAFIESKLGTRGTARNWNTVLRIAAMV